MDSHADVNLLSSNVLTLMRPMFERIPPDAAQILERMIRNEIATRPLKQIAYSKPAPDGTVVQWELGQPCPYLKKGVVFAMLWDSDANELLIYSAELVQLAEHAGQEAVLFYQTVAHNNAAPLDVSGGPCALGALIDEIAELQDAGAPAPRRSNGAGAGARAS